MNSVENPQMSYECDMAAENARLREALAECITETPGAACYNTGKKTRRLEAINEIARAAISKATE